LNSGKVDGASMLIELAMKAKEQGIDLKAVALGHRENAFLRDLWLYMNAIKIYLAIHV